MEVNCHYNPNNALIPIMLNKELLIVCGVPDWPSWNFTNSKGVGTNFVFNSDGTPSAGPFLELDDYRLAQTRYLNAVMKSQMHY